MQVFIHFLLYCDTSYLISQLIAIVSQSPYLHLFIVFMCVLEKHHRVATQWPSMGSIYLGLMSSATKDESRWMKQLSGMPKCGKN